MIETEDPLVVGVFHTQCVSFLDVGVGFRGEFKLVIEHFASKDVGVK